MKRVHLQACFWVLLFVSTSASAASFDCSKANTRVEHSICNDKTLNDADTLMGLAYRAVRAALDPAGAKALRSEQLQWVRERDATCDSSDISCLLSATERRTVQLVSKVSQAELPRGRLASDLAERREVEHDDAGPPKEPDSPETLRVVRRDEMARLLFGRDLPPKREGDPEFVISRTADGKVLVGERYVDGSRDGVWVAWHKGGSKAFEGNYDQGSRHGEWTQWYADGQLEVQGTYVDDKKEDRWTVWYENGQRLEEGQYARDVRQGVWTRWYENGQVGRVSEYRDGKLHGRQTTYLPNGTIFDDETGQYVDGTLVARDREPQFVAVRVIHDGQIEAITDDGSSVRIDVRSDSGVDLTTYVVIAADEDLRLGTIVEEGDFLGVVLNPRW